MQKRVDTMKARKKQRLGEETAAAAGAASALEAAPQSAVAVRPSGDALAAAGEGALAHAAGHVNFFEEEERGVREAEEDRLKEVAKLKADHAQLKKMGIAPLQFGVVFA